MSVLNVTDANSTTGAGVIDSWHSVVTACNEVKDAHGADAAAVGVEIGVTIVGAIADTAAFVLDPLAKLIAAGLGWLIEHVSFLKKPLDLLAGNPEEIKKMADQLHKIGETLRQASTDMDSAQKAQVKNWKGDAYDTFTKQVADRKGAIDAGGQSTDIAGYVVETTMALITVTRSLIRDLITTLLGDIISTVLIGLALAPVTFGASLVAAVGKSVAAAVAAAVSFAAKLARIVGLGGRTVARLETLAAKIKPPTGSGASTHELDDIRPNTGTGTPHDETPPATPHDETPPATPHDETPPATPHDETPPATPHDETPPATPHDETPPGSTPHDEDDPYQTWLQADQHFNPQDHPATPHDETPPATPHDETPPATPHDETPPATPHDETPPATPHDDGTDASSVRPPAEDGAPATGSGSGAAESKLKPYDIPFMKKHEQWLNANAKAGWDKVKFVDNFVKNSPTLKKYYPAFKALGDAKSSKNWVGWTGKAMVNFDKAMTDIQMQADAAWAESGQQWSEAHPDPAAGDQQQQPAPQPS